MRPRSTQSQVMLVMQALEQQLMAWQDPQEKNMKHWARSSLSTEQL